MSRRKRGKRPRNSDQARTSPSIGRGRRWIWSAAVLASLGSVAMFALLRIDDPAPEPPDAAVSSTDVPILDTANMQPLVAGVIDETRRDVIDQPHSPIAWAKLGAACEAHHLFGPAEKCYRRALALAPDDFRWTYFLAIVLEAVGRDSQESIDLYREAIRYRPRYAPLWFRIGEALARRGELEPARDAYRQALDLDNTLAIAHYAYGQVLLKLDDSKTAVHHLKRASSMAPKDGPAAAALAQGYMRIGDRTRALRVSEASSRLSAVLTLNDPERALVAAMGASSKVCYRRAVQYLKSGRPREAMPYLQVLEQVKPQDPKVPLWLAFAHLKLGDPKLSRSYLDRTLRLKADLEDADRTLAPLPIARHRLDRTIHEFRREYLHTLTQRGDTPELRRALTEFEEASAEMTMTATAYLAWGNALLEIGEPAEAGLRYLDASGLDPDNADVYFNLGLVAETLGNLEEAIAYYDRAAQTSPDSELTNKLAQLRTRANSP